MAGLRDELLPQINNIEEEARSLQSNYTPVPQYEPTQPLQYEPVQPLPETTVDSGYRYSQQEPGFGAGVIAGAEDIAGTSNVLLAGAQQQLGFTDAAVDSMNQAAQYFGRSQKRLQNKSITEMNSIGDFTTAIAEQAGRMLPSIITSIGTAGPIGAAAQNLVTTMAKRAAAKRVGQSVGASLGMSLGEGGEYFSNMALDTPERRAWESRMGKDVEGDVARNADGIAMSFGEQFGVNLAGAAVSGALNFLPLATALKKLPGNTGVPRFQEIISRMGTTGLEESGTEVMQTFLEQATANYINENRDLISDSNAEELMTAAALAFPMGALFGGIGGVGQATGEFIGETARIRADRARQEKQQKLKDFFDQMAASEGRPASDMNTYQIDTTDMYPSMDEGYDPFQNDEMDSAMADYINYAEDGGEQSVASEAVGVDFQMGRNAEQASEESAGKIIDRILTDSVFDPRFVSDLPVKDTNNLGLALDDADTLSKKAGYIPVLDLVKKLVVERNFTIEQVKSLGEALYRRLSNNTLRGTAENEQRYFENQRQQLQEKLSGEDPYKLGAYRSTPGVGKLVNTNLGDNAAKIKAIKERVAKYKDTPANAWRFKKAEEELATLRGTGTPTTEAFNLKLYELGVQENVAKLQEQIKQATEEGKSDKVKSLNNSLAEEQRRLSAPKAAKLTYVNAARSGDVDALIDFQSAYKAATTEGRKASGKFKAPRVLPTKQGSDLGTLVSLAEGHRSFAQDQNTKADLVESNGGKAGLPSFWDMGGVTSMLSSAYVKIPNDPSAQTDSSSGVVELTDKQVYEGHPQKRIIRYLKEGQKVNPEYHVKAVDFRGDPITVNLASLGSIVLSKYSNVKMRDLPEDIGKDMLYSLEAGLNSLIADRGIHITDIPANTKVTRNGDLTWGELQKFRGSKEGDTYFRHNADSSMGVETNEALGGEFDNKEDITNPGRAIFEEDKIVQHPRQGGLPTSATWTGAKILDSKRDDPEYRKAFREPLTDKEGKPLKDHKDYSIEIIKQATGIVDQAKREVVRRAGRVHATAIEVKTKSVKSKTKANYEADYAAVTNSSRISKAQKLMQANANEIFKRLGIKESITIADYSQLPKAAVEFNREGRLHGLEFKTRTGRAIYVNPFLDTSEAYRVYAHEMGHTITKLAFEHASPSVQEKIIKDWMNWVEEWGGDLTPLVDEEGAPLRSLSEIKAKMEGNLDKFRADKIAKKIAMGAAPVDSYAFAEQYKATRSENAQKYIGKETAKAYVANKSIADGVEGSTAAFVANFYGPKNKMGEYSDDDVVFVSSNGKRKGRKPVAFEKDGKWILRKEYSDVKKAIAAGATFVADNHEHLTKTQGYNLGEVEFAKYLSQNGYVRTDIEINGQKLGFWRPKSRIKPIILNSFSIAKLGAFRPSANAVLLNRDKLRKDYEQNLKHMRTDPQKKEVFKNVDVDKLKLWFDNNGGFESYYEFVKQHEFGHYESGHGTKARPLPKDKMSKDALQMEAEANTYAYKQLGIDENSMQRQLDIQNGMISEKGGKVFGGVDFQDYHLMFDEYMAERVAYWLMTDAKPQTVVQKFFGKLAAAIRSLWNFADRPSRNIESWLNDLWKKNSTFTKDEMKLYTDIRDKSNELPKKVSYARKSKAEKAELIATSKPLLEKIAKAQQALDSFLSKTVIHESARTEVDRVVKQIEAVRAKVVKAAQVEVGRLKTLRALDLPEDISIEKLGEQFHDMYDRNTKLNSRIRNIVQNQWPATGVDINYDIYELMIESHASGPRVLKALRQVQKREVSLANAIQRHKAAYTKVIDNIEYQIERINLAANLHIKRAKEAVELPTKEQMDNRATLQTRIAEAKQQFADATKAVENKYRLARKQKTMAKIVKDVDNKRRAAIASEIGLEEYKRITGKAPKKQKGAPVTPRVVQEEIEDLGLTTSEVTSAGNLTSNDFSTRVMGFLQVFNSDLLNKEEREIILKAADSFYIRKQLKQTLPEIYSEIVDTDPEMAAAYMFDMYRAGLLDTGANTKSIFHKIIRWIAEVFGIVSTSDRAVSIFDFMLEENDAARNARLTDPAIRIATPKQLLDTRTQRLFDKIRPSLEYAGQKLEQLFAPVNFRFSKNPYLQQVLQKLWADPTRRRQAPSYREAQDAALSRLTNDLEFALGETIMMDKDLQRQLMFHMQRGTTSSDRRVATAQEQLRKWFNAASGYAKSRGLEMGYIKDFFPQVWSPETIVADYNNFVAGLASDMPDNFVPVDKKGEPKYTKSEFAEKIANTLISNEGGAELDFKDEAALANPYMGSFQTRSLNWINRDKMAPYLDQDFLGTMGKYVKQLVRRAEYVQTFGENGAQIEALLKQAEATGATAGEIREVRDFLDGVLGVRASDFVRKHPKWAKAIQMMSVFQALRTLSTAGFANLADIGGLFVRGDARSGLWAMTTGLKEEYRQYAEDIGAVERVLAAEIVAQGYDTHGLTGKTAKVADWFFKVNGVQALTRATRAMGTALANRMFHEWSQDINKFRADIEEMGLQPEDLKFTFTQDGDPMLKVMSASQEAAYFRLLDDPKIPDAEKVSIRNKLNANSRKIIALNRFVNSTMLRPDAVSRPNWANDPRYHLLFQLKGFMYKFWDVYHRRVFNELMYSNKYNALAGLFLFAPIFFIAEFLRDLVQHLGEGDPRKDKWGFSDYIDDSAQRGGVYGPFELITNVADDLHYNRIPGRSLAGPSVEWAMDWGSVALGDRNLGKQLERSLPGQNLYMPMIRAIQDDR